MQINNARQKRKNIARALESIPGPTNQRIQVFTESTQIKPILQSQPFKLIKPMDNNDDGRGLKRFYRYKQPIEQQKQGNIGNYKSLQLARRGVKKRSEQKILAYNSIDNSPYRLAMAKKSANSLQLVEQIKEQPFLAKRLSRQNRKSSLPKKISVSLTKKKEAILDRYKKIGGESAEELKEMSRNEMKRGHFTAALKLLSRIEEGSETDIELLDLGGVCLMHLKQFDAAALKFKRLIALDKHFNKQVYISLALCQNQLNRTADCLSHVDECIGLFPLFYEGFYFKGKVLFRDGKYNEALQTLQQASRLNTGKKQINLLIGECYEKMGDEMLAVEYYKSNISDIHLKNIKYVARLGNILINVFKEQQVVSLLIKCMAFIDTMPSRSRQVDGYALECNYLLCLAYYRQANFEMALMKGEQILKSMNSQWILKTIRIMIVVKVRQHNLYGAIYFVERLDYFKVSMDELKQYVTFCEGVVQLIKKKTVEGIAKLEELIDFFSKKEVINELNSQINKVYHMYLSYAYLLTGQYSKALHQIEMQNQLQVSPYYSPILQYDKIICLAIVEYNHLRFEQANKLFQDSLSIFPDKVETKLYMVICNFKLYFRASAIHQQTIRLRIRNFLNDCADAVSEINSNYSSHIFYFKGLYHAWQGQWAEAACDLDIAIEKSEDNFFDFFYLRALVLANLQSYKPAINDVSVAISLQEESASGYLLRARCLQIDGNPTQAFADLQTFIALRPQDKQIHKFAGHMLFENGAFEDALQAYSQGDINKFDLQVYLTRSKTYFLLGNFQKASADMLEAARTVPDKQEYIFDYEMMKWLGELLHQFVKNQTEDEYVFDHDRLTGNFEQLLQLYKGVAKESGKYGKIFKLSEFLTLSALCYFYLQEYNKAIDNLIEAIELKRASIETGDELEGDYQEQQTQKLVFINQMYYNVALCFCMVNDYPNAERYLKKCRISQQLHNHEIFMELLGQIKGTIVVEENEVYMDLFSLRNKLSRYIPKVRVPFLCSKDDRICYRSMKLCFPYPKVEPPEISPAFQTRLLTEIDINQIERRPEAPWIYKENNSVKFTDRIDVYSRFEMEKSEVQKSVHKIHMGDFMNSMSDSSVSMRGQADLKKKLLLDSDVEQKLNKLINKAMNKAK